MEWSVMAGVWLVASTAWQSNAWIPGDLVGAPTCGECHQQQYAKQAFSRHALALRPIKETRLPQLLMGRLLRERNGISFEYQLLEDGLQITAQKNGDKASALLEWAFGAGAQGITPVGRVKGHYFEHRISYYTEPAEPARTIGHPGEPSPSPLAALGQIQTAETIFRCFNCHATGVRPGPQEPDLSAMRPGIECERCHGPGRLHVAAARSGPLQPDLVKSIVNPGRLPASALVEMCGECHRSSMPGPTAPTLERDDSVSVRFQPVGFKSSRCFSASKNFSCLTCHNPHEDAHSREDLFYTEKCVACHRDVPQPNARCQRATRPNNTGQSVINNRQRNCLPCHMRRTSPLPHLTFTDHQIRVYEPQGTRRAPREQ